MMIRGILVGPGFRIGNSASRQLRGSLPPSSTGDDAPGPGACACPSARRAPRPRSARCGAGRCARTPRHPVCLGSLVPRPRPARPGPARTPPPPPPGIRSASSCAGRRTRRTPWVSSYLSSANHLRHSCPGHGAPARCPSDRTARVLPHRTDCLLLTNPQEFPLTGVSGLPEGGREHHPAQAGGGSGDCVEKKGSGGAPRAPGSRLTPPTGERHRYVCTYGPLRDDLSR